MRDASINAFSSLGLKFTIVRIIISSIITPCSYIRTSVNNTLPPIAIERAAKFITIY